MAIGRPKAMLVLSAEEHAQVASLAASRSLPHAMVVRAKLVLWAAQGESNTAIAERLNWSMPTVGKWRPMFRILTNPYVYGVIIGNVVAMVALQNSFYSARGIIAMPLSSALSNIVPIAGGMIVFGERLPAGPARTTARIGAFVLTILGSALLANAQEEVAVRVISAGAAVEEN